MADSMLRYFYENDLVRIYEETPKDWEAAVRLSCENFLEKKLIGKQYVAEIIDCVKEYGPYIVLVPGVVMPHASGNSSGVYGTGISFSKMSKEVFFEEGNPEKAAKLFFVLAAKNNEEHMENIAKLSELLMTEGLIEALYDINNIADYQKVMESF